MRIISLSMNIRIWYFLFTYFSCLAVTYLKLSCNSSLTSSISIEFLIIQHIQSIHIFLYTKYYKFCRAVSIRQAHAKPARSQREGSSFLRRRIPTASFHLFFVSHFLPESPPHASVHLPNPHFLDLSFSSFSQTLHISLSAPIRTENSFSLQLYFPLFRNLKALRFFSIFYVLSFYPLQLIALVLGPFRIVSSDLPCPIRSHGKDLKTNEHPVKRGNTNNFIFRTFIA